MDSRPQRGKEWIDESTQDVADRPDHFIAGSQAALHEFTIDGRQPDSQPAAWVVIGKHGFNFHHGSGGGQRVPPWCCSEQRHHLDHAARAEGPLRGAEKLPNREALYGEFITEASRLTMEPLCHSLERPDTFVKLYGITGRIRLVATNPVLAAAEAGSRQFIDLYSKPKMNVEQIRRAFECDGLDPIKDFSITCRGAMA